MPAPLDRFRKRLDGGVCKSVTKARQADSGRDDEAALREWLKTKPFRALSSVHDEEWEPGTTPEQAIDRLAAELTGHAKLLDAVIYAPGTVLDRLFADADTGASDTKAVDVWIAMCWTAQAAWQAVTTALPATADPGITQVDLVLLQPLAARLRFLALSEPMRARGPARQPHWWDWPPDHNLPCGDGIFGRVLGDHSSWVDLVDTCREARNAWQDFLDHHQDHRLLRLSRTADLEEELKCVLFRDGGWSRPLSLATTRLADPAGLTYEDRELVQAAVESHFLPRFALLPVTLLILDGDHAGRRVARAGFAVLVVAAATAAVVCFAKSDLNYAVYLAVAVYALVCLGIVILPEGPTWALMWLLRMPAASAVGIIALDSFMPGGWLNKPTKTEPVGWVGALGWHAVALLIAASFGYLLIQARNHGVSQLQAVGRAFLVTVIGAVHALLVSLLGLIVIAPAFVQSGYQLHSLWATLGASQEAQLLALAAAWCLAFGVFSQILWDDRPITAPLAHLNWQRAK